MAQITALMIKELRDRTGVGMSKCKTALEETNGDMEEAIANLRKSGMASAVKKAERATNEGSIAIKETNEHVVVAEANAETDFVVNNDLFQNFLKNIVEEISTTKPASLEAFLQQPYSKDKGLTIDEYRASIIQTIGENIQVRRFQIFKAEPNKSLGVYSHLGGKIVTLVEISGSEGEGQLARDIAMHIAAASPEYLSPETVPQEIIDKEKEIARSQMAGKPDNVIDKIINGKMEAYYADSCLVRQKYIKNDSLSIADVVQARSKETGKPLTITRFIRWAVGQ